MIDLGALGGYSVARVAVDVSDTGQVVGDSTADRSSTAFSWTPRGGMVDLPTLGGDSYTYAVNESGQVVGYSDIAAPGADVEYHAFSWTASGGIVDLGTLGGDSTEAVAVNERGQVVGYSNAGHAFSWTANGGMVELPALADDVNTIATAVNNNGAVVGTSWGLDSAQHATMWLLSLTVESALDKVIQQVSAYGLQHGLKNALIVKLEAALASWQRNANNTAVNQIGAFVRQVNAMRGKDLTDLHADTLLGMADDVIHAISSQ